MFCNIKLIYLASKEIVIYIVYWCIMWIFLRVGCIVGNAWEFSDTWKGKLEFDYVCVSFVKHMHLNNHWFGNTGGKSKLLRLYKCLCLVE